MTLENRDPGKSDLLKTDNRHLFDGLARSYDRHRPGYPSVLFERIVARLPTRANLALDVAAGTGLSTAALLAALPPAWSVIAIEPGHDMRCLLHQRFQAELRVEVKEGAAEALAVPDQSAGLITACTAFHWFDAGRFLDEARRALIPAGILAIITNVRIKQPVTKAFDAYLLQFEPLSAEAIAARPERHEQVLKQAAGFSALERDTVRWSIELTMEELISVWLTRSFAKQLLQRLGKNRVETDLEQIYRTRMGNAPTMLDYDSIALTVERSP